MPLERGGVEWLNTTEAAEEFGSTYITFKSLADEIGIEGQAFAGKGQRKFFKRSIVERLRDTPKDKLPELREALLQEGEIKR